ncbi:hypothetical protein Angca_005185 [Angiostrongylus cantonensis]|nr:hypothetical protein Angca_005185 [Angiostrongylus cantonensis]
MRHPLFLLLLFSKCCLAAGQFTVVIDLNEKFLDVSDEGLWIVKAIPLQFYAPWCAHCKRLLPVWEHLGHAVSDKNLPVRVAKMDCTRFTSACNKLSINGYPTIIFFRHGRKIEYFGERAKEALFNFVVKSAAPVVEKVNGARLNEIRRDSRNDPSFVIIGDEKDDMQAEFEVIADSLFWKVSVFFSTADSEVPTSLRESGARVAVFKDSSFFPYYGSVAIIAEGLSSWIIAERWPLMPRASSSNLADIASTGKLIVLVICSEGRQAAEDLRKSEYLWSRFQFAWLDGPELATNIVMGNMDPPNILVFNFTTYEYYLNEDDPDKITRASLVTWLNNLADGIEKGVLVPLGGRSLPTRMRRMIFEVYSNITQMFATQPLLSSVLFGMPIAFLSIICYSICSADFTVDREDFYPDDEEYEETVDDDEHSHLIDPSHPKNE